MNFMCSFQTLLSWEYSSEPQICLNILYEHHCLVSPVHFIPEILRSSASANAILAIDEYHITLSATSTFVAHGLFHLHSHGQLGKVRRRHSSA
jgi:hypothetical protein